MFIILKIVLEKMVNHVICINILFRCHSYTPVSDLTKCNSQNCEYEFCNKCKLLYSDHKNKWYGPCCTNECTCIDCYIKNHKRIIKNDDDKKFCSVCGGSSKNLLHCEVCEKCYCKSCESFSKKFLGRNNPYFNIGRYISYEDKHFVITHYIPKTLSYMYIYNILSIKSVNDDSTINNSNIVMLNIHSDINFLQHANIICVCRDIYNETSTYIKCRFCGELYHDKCLPSEENPEVWEKLNGCILCRDDEYIDMNKTTFNENELFVKEIIKDIINNTINKINQKEKERAEKNKVKIMVDKEGIEAKRINDRRKSFIIKDGSVICSICKEYLYENQNLLKIQVLFNINRVI